MLWVWNIKGKAQLVAYQGFEKDIEWDVEWYNERESEWRTKRFLAYGEASNFEEDKKKKYQDVYILRHHFLNFQKRQRLTAQNLYANFQKGLDYKEYLAVVDEKNIPQWLPEPFFKSGVSYLISTFWWQYSAVKQQCTKPILLDLGDDLFFAVSKYYDQDISTYYDKKSHITPACFVDGILFDMPKPTLIRCLEGISEFIPRNYLIEKYCKSDKNSRSQEDEDRQLSLF